MTPLERFQKWQGMKEKDRYGFSFSKAIDILRESGYDNAMIAALIAETSFWLRANADKPKANKRNWGRFMLNWAKPKNYQQGGRLEPSSFD